MSTLSHQHGDHIHLSPEAREMADNNFESLLWKDGDMSTLQEDELAAWIMTADYSPRELRQRIRQAIKRAELEGRAAALREAIQNPGRKSYFAELLNDTLKELKTLEGEK